MKLNQPIGVFDSGVGGLTVLEKLASMFPGEDYIYVADQGYCPYGTKTPEEIEARVLTIGKYLLSRNVKAIVIACNTASLFKESLEKITDIPIISVIEPTAQMAIATSITKKIAVLATNATIAKGTYQKILTDNGISVYPVPASEFVDIIENDLINTLEAADLVKQKLSPLLNQGIDTIIHGCTHFGLLEAKYREVISDVHYIECGTPTSVLLGKTLNLAKDNKLQGEVEIYTTGKASDLEAKIKWFKISHQPIQEI